MKKQRLKISAGAALLLSALYLMCGWDMLFVIALPVIFHEMGHWLALRLMGARVRQMRISLAGLDMRYTGRVSCAGEFLAALSGPLAGIAYAVAASYCGGKLALPLLTKSAGVSILLSGFNLLPCLPLDGGRMLSALLTPTPDGGDRAMELVGTVTGAIILIAGLVFVWQGRGLALELAAVWLLLAQPGIVKKPAVL